jgi:AAA15 family ATPase/GTPase
MLLYFEIKNSRSFDENGIHFSLLATDRCKDEDGAELLPDHLIDVPKYGVKVLKTAAICGANASGKSNVIKCLFNMLDIVRNSFTGTFANKDFLTDNFSSRILGKTALLPYFPNKNNKENVGKPSVYTLGLLIEGVHFEYSFSYNHERILSEHLLEYVDNDTEISHFNRKYDALKRKYIYFNLSEKFKETLNHQAVTRGNNLFLSAIHHFEEHESLRIDFAENIFEKIENIGIREEHHEVEKSLYFMQKMGLLEQFGRELQKVDFLISEIKVDIEEKESSTSIEKITSYHKEIDFDFMKEESKGTQTFVGWFAYIFFCLKNGATLFIDEFGTYMHPLLTRYFIDLFYANNQTNAQLIFATHDIKLMDRRYTRDDQVFLMQRSKEGDSRLERLSDYEIDDKYVILDNLYLQGVFGAIPNINTEKNGFLKETK